MMIQMAYIALCAPSLWEPGPAGREIRLVSECAPTVIEGIAQGTTASRSPAPGMPGRLGGRTAPGAGPWPKVPRFAMRLGGKSPNLDGFKEIFRSRPHLRNGGRKARSR